MRDTGAWAKRHMWPESRKGAMGGESRWGEGEEGEKNLILFEKRFNET